MTIGCVLEQIRTLNFKEEVATIAEPILKEISSRLTFLVSVGLDYLSLNRTSGTLSGGEAQRIRLATQVGSGLVGVCYVLDEPTIGLHARDTKRLLATLRHLSDIGNTVLIVEHDEGIMRSSDHVIDFGPLAGFHGGEIIAQGTVSAIEKSATSLTGKYLSKKLTVPLPKERRECLKELEIVRARKNNLRDISDVPYLLVVLYASLEFQEVVNPLLSMESLLAGVRSHLQNKKVRTDIFDSINFNR